MEKISANSTAKKVLVPRIHQEVLKLKRKKKKKKKNAVIKQGTYMKIYFHKYIQMVKNIKRS